MNPTLDRVAKEIGESIEDELQRSGIFYRIFFRVKTVDSIQRKLISKDYANSVENKLMQDLIGIRITSYFEDDLPIIYSFLRNKTNYQDETVDETDVSVFKPHKINLIFKMNDSHSKETFDTVIQKYQVIDNTYEIQLRTVLSEGWHEVEHDLRYKCKEDWTDHSDISHIFNGVYASLVTSDWSIISIFDNLAFRHYKSKNWSAMLRNKFRLRFKEGELDPRLIKILNSDMVIAKDLYKIDRNDFITKMFRDRLRIPITLSNVIYILNAYYLRIDQITNITPDFVITNKNLFK